MPTRIYFYSTTGDYGFMSNFSRHSIKLDGVRWPTTEHYFQAQKFRDTSHVAAVRAASTPDIAASMGRDRKRPLRRDWEAVKDNVMRKAVLAKFTQHDDLRSALIATEDATLVEETSDDDYWGCGSDGSGKNMLGRILMEVRNQLRR